MKDLKSLLVTSILIILIGAIFSSCMSPGERRQRRHFIAHRKAEDLGRHFQNRKTKKLFQVIKIYYKENGIGFLRQDLVYEFEDRSGKTYKLSCGVFLHNHEKIDDPDVLDELERLENLRNKQ